VSEVNTFAGFVRKYEDVATRMTKFSNVECPHCQRKFNDRAAERHIPICAELHRFKKSEKKLPGPKRGRSCRLDSHAEQFCTHCGFKFSMGHKYCSNCGKKR
jgi:predicted amidophosphoribosyltransferase